MELIDVIRNVLQSYGPGASQAPVERVNSGHINHTFKVGEEFILQRINKKVFHNPEVLSHNLQLATQFLNKRAPEYLFLRPIINLRGNDLTYDDFGYAWRLFPYIQNTETIDEVKNKDQAYQAAKAFGQLSRLLAQCDVSPFRVPIPDFHNLSFRYRQFDQATVSAAPDRKAIADELIDQYKSQRNLVKEYESMITSNRLILRIFHNDTKINNVLFDKESGKAVCVIDLDTLMPGYFVYDLGDMVRTFVSPVAEDESDFKKIRIREDVRQALLEGYLSEMNSILTEAEKSAITLAGPLMTYMIGLRFLTDYLSGDIYYKVNDQRHNLRRAQNQIELLRQLIA